MATTATTEAPAVEAAGSTTQLIPVDRIVPADINREDYGDLDELAASIKRDGLLQPITVAPREDGNFDLIYGERRWRATVKAKLETIEAKVLKLDPVERIVQQLAENIHRKELTPLERARQLHNLLTVAADHGRKLTQAQAAERLGFKSQGQVSKYLTLHRLYNGVPAFKAAWNAGKVTVAEAVELGSLTRQPEKHADVIERVLQDGFSSTISAAVKRERDRNKRRIEREAKVKELEDAGARIAPEDWAKQGGRRIDQADSKAVNLDPKQHASEPCHAVYVTATAQVEPICMEPARHVKGAESNQSGETTTGGKPATGTSGAPTAAKTSGASEPADEPETETEAAASPPNGSQDASVEPAEADPHEAERAAHEEALRQATTERQAMVRGWLAGRRKLSRPVTDKYVFGQFLNLSLREIGDVDLDYLGEVLGLEDESADIVSAVERLAAEDEEKLRRVAVALICELVESHIKEGDYRSAMVTSHYGLLTAELGYEFSEAELEELDQPDSAT